ncbi:MAG: helix-turn-helix domain-containing protein [Leptospirales bacterium]
MVSNGFLSLKFGLFYTEDISMYPRMLGIEPMMHSFSITAYFYYLPYLGNVSVNWKSWKNLVLIIPILQIVLYLDYCFLSDVWHQELVETAVAGGHPFYFPGLLSQILHTGYIASLFPVGIFLFRRTFDWRKVTGPKKNTIKSGFTVVVAWALFCMVLSAEYAWNGTYGIRQSAWNPLLLYGSAIIFFHFWQVWPYYIKAGSVLFEAKTFKLDGFYRKYLKGINLKELENKIKHLIEERKIYMEEDLSLPKFADELNLSVHQLSEYFNLHMQIHFLDFINIQRIEETKRLLDEEPDKPIIEICFQAGFNSNSSFYSTFKNMTGYTPKSWRNRKKPGKDLTF